MYGTLRGDAGLEVKLRGMITGPRRSQKHPRVAFTKQACPRVKGCGRARSSACQARLVGRKSTDAGLKALVGSRRSERSTPPAAV
eukprot:1762853-Pleurochrysis_carterae.AAC.1